MEIPTVAESVPGYESSAWYGVVGPAGMPAEVVARLNAEMRRALDFPESRERLASIGSAPVHGTPEQFRAFMQAETIKWAKVIKDSGTPFVD